MKVLILAGGRGTRLGNITKLLPKPMIKIGNNHLIMHLIKIYALQGFTEFYIATGFKSRVFKNFFYKICFRCNKNKSFFIIKIDNIICKVNLIFSGKSSMTAGRLKILSKKIKDNIFFLTYGDALANIDLKKLLYRHIKSKLTVTVTGVNTTSRFGQLLLKNNKVVLFSEKKINKDIWINGGFFVINKKFISLIKNKHVILEGYPLETLAKRKQLGIYKHRGYWQCVDTQRDLDLIKKHFKKNKIKPWLNFKKKI